MLRLVAHELRAHLSVLNGYSSLLAEDDRVRRDPALLTRALGEIRSHLDKLTDISGHLVDAVNQPDQPVRLPMVVAPLDLSGAAREALDMTAEVARRHRVELRLDDHALGSQPVYGDRFQLVVAMRNLLDNACAHGPDGGEVVLQLCREGGDVAVLVRDQGSGIHVLGRRAFKPLRRGRATREREGLGLGLSLVEEVARSHGGRVVWSSEPDGACVGMRFPDRAAQHA